MSLQKKATKVYTIKQMFVLPYTHLVVI